MKNNTFRKLLSVLLAAMIVSLAAAFTGAATTGTITRIYGTETEAIACKGFDDFYASNMFVWFQMDTSISCPSSMATMLNQQVLGDSTLKDAAGNKIKIGGLTVKQLNAAAGNPYSAMVAFENNGSDKLRVSIWLSWGGSSIQDVFNKEVHSEVTVELLTGFKVPDNGYSMSNKIYADIAPVKYKISIADLEYLDQPSNPGYTSEKATWMKPMFENLTAQWVLVSGVTPTTGQSSAVSSASSSSSSSSSSAATSTAASTTSSVAGSTGDSSAVLSDSSEAESMESGEISSQAEDSSEASSSAAASQSQTSSEPSDDEGLPILPIILGALGVVILGGGIGYFLYLKKKGV
ncbi:MAG: hypothetical protein ACYC5K_08170 [Saccharofermentanales bacterium]